MRPGRDRTDAQRAGRGRRLAALGAVLMLTACLLPWYRVVGDLPTTEMRAFDGPGMLAFVAAVATLALLAFRWARASTDAPVIDRPIAFVLLAGAALLGVVLWPFGVLDEPRGLLPDRAPGLWLALAAAVVLVVAAAETWRDPAAE
jgi:hypothetical protein